jgi:hypothetical protein
MCELFYEIGTITYDGVKYRVGVTNLVGPDQVQLYQGATPVGSSFPFEYGAHYEDRLRALAVELIFEEVYRKHQDVIDFDPILIEE